MKRVISAVLTLLLVLALAACTQNTPPVADPTEAPVVTEDPAVTEAPVVTEEPVVTEAPAPAVQSEEDVAKLAAFFEKADDAGVKNGEKLFDAYDPADPDSWTGKGRKITWNAEGRLKSIVLWDDEAERGSVELAGLMELYGVEFLEELYIGPEIVLESIDVNNCPNLMTVRIAEPVSQYAKFLSAVPEDDFHFAARDMVEARLIGSVPNDLMDGDPFDEREIVLVAEGYGYVGIGAGPNDEDGEYEIAIFACPDEGNRFNGWLDEMAEPYSFEPEMNVTFEQPPLGDGFVLSALFGEVNAMIPEYEGEAPTASAEIIEVEPNVPTKVDLDFDGKPDTVTLTDNGPTEGIGEGNGVKITVELGSNPGKAVTLYENDYVESFALRVLDCDTSDDRLELLFNAFGANLSEIVIAYRVNDSGSIDAFPIERNAVIETEPYNFMDAHGTFDMTQGIPVSMRTEIFDTQYITARMTITADGFRVISPYIFPDSHGYRELKRDMKAYQTLDGVDQGITLPEGTMFKPIETDSYSYVKLQLKDGGSVYIHIELHDWIVTIDGIPQEEYCEIWVAE